MSSTVRLQYGDKFWFLQRKNILRVGLSSPSLLMKGGADGRMGGWMDLVSPCTDFDESIFPFLIKMREIWPLAMELGIEVHLNWVGIQPCTWRILQYNVTLSWFSSET